MTQDMTPDAIAEGRRLLAVFHAQAEGPLFWAAREDLISFALANLPALLRAASERDAAVREVERLRAGLRELAEPPGPHADEIAWNMAERAEQILASAAQGGANG